MGTILAHQSNGTEGSPFILIWRLPLDEVPPGPRPREPLLWRGLRDRDMLIGVENFMRNGPRPPEPFVQL